MRPPLPGGACPSDQIAGAAVESAARAAVPSLLLPQRPIEFRERLIREYCPVGPTELSMVNDLARHAAAMELWEETAGAVERQASRRLPDVTLTPVIHYEVAEDAVLAGSMSPDIVDRCERYGLPNVDNRQAFPMPVPDLRRPPQHWRVRRAFVRGNLLANVAWSLDVARSRRLTFIVRLLSWRQRELPTHDASQNVQRLLPPFWC